VEFIGTSFLVVHYNPAVSLAVVIRGKLTVGEWTCYTGTQLAPARPPSP
jgi:glycerol uptake facilitator-like aquaporin